jgi:hypothetical protein
MQPSTLKACAEHDDMVKLEIPTDLADQEIEIVLVMQPLTDELLDAMGYFEDTCAASYS